MKIRSATFFMSRGAERKWQRTVLPYLRCLQNNKGQPKSKGLSFIHKSFFFCSLGDSPIWRLTLLLTNAA